MNLIHEKSKEEYAMIEVRPEGSIDILGSNTTLNRWDMVTTHPTTAKFIINEIIFSIIMVANKIFCLMDGEPDVHAYSR
jgi:hypothetical protein